MAPNGAHRGAFFCFKIFETFIDLIDWICSGPSNVNFDPSLAISFHKPTTNSAGDTSGTWTTFNSHGLSAAHEVGNTYAESGVSGGAVYNPAAGTVSSTAHGFGMRFN